MNQLFLRAHLALFLLLPFLFVGCGGGGGGSTGRDLAVDFGYGSDTVPLWRPITKPLIATGLEGSVPDCSVIAGSLPAGLVLQQRGCQIDGTPTRVATTVVTIRLTVSGFNGQVDKELSFTVDGPPLNYPLDLSGRRGSPISVRPTPGQWTPTAAEIVSYALESGALPSGLQLESTTGEIRGILTETAVNTFAISATVVGPLGSTSGLSQTYTYTTVRDGLLFFYGPNDSPVTIQAGDSISLPALLNFGFYLSSSNYSFGVYRLAARSASLPTGLTLDPLTGQLSGLPTVSGAYALYFEVELRSAGQSVWYPSAVLELTIAQ